MVRWRDRPWAAPVTLAVLAPVLAEILSGNIPPRVFVLPWIFGFLLVAYGIPVLLIRDAWVRFGFGVPNLFALGLAYGFVNEALFAKTVFLNENVPIDSFNGYGGDGFNLAWATFIVPWHALHSVVYPIVFAWALFPADRQRVWLGPRLSIGLGAGALVLGTVIHFGAEHVQGTAMTYAVSLTLIGFFALLGFLVPRTPKLLEGDWPGRKAPWVGACVALFLFFMALPASQGWPASTLVLLAAGFFAVLVALIVWRRGFEQPSFLRFALGNEIAFVAMSMIFDAQRGAWDTLVAHVVMEIAFLWGLGRVRPVAGAASVRPPATSL